MNDEFLYQLRESPQPEFAEALYEGISPDRRKTMLRVPTMKRIALSLAALCLVFATVFFASPVARARVMEVIRNISIGGVEFVLTEQYPDESLLDELYPEEDTEFRRQTVSLAKAQARLPFNIPTWVPGGYVLEDDVVITQPAEGAFPEECPSSLYDVGWVYLRWENGSGEVIFLHASYPAEAQTIIGPKPGTVEEVEVNGRPAALVHGGWDLKTKQYHATGLTLSWRQDRVLYSLGANEQISADDLIQMAESMP